MKKIVILTTLILFLFIIILLLDKKKEYNTNKVSKVYITVKEKIGDEYTYGTIKINNQKKYVKIKLRGHSTKDAKKKSYTIKLNNDEKIFNLSKSNKYVLISNTFDKTLIRNKMVYDFANKSKMKYNVKSIYVDLYLNNKYVGNYLLCDKIDIGKNKINIDENENYLLEYDVLNNDKNKKYITTNKYKWRFQVKNKINNAREKTLLKKFNKIEKVIEENKFEVIKRYIDIDSFIDSYIIEEFFKNVDCNHSSLYFYLKDNKLYAGPIWDFDLSIGLTMRSNDNDFEYLNERGLGNNSNHSYEGFYCNKNIYSELLKNKEFKKQVKNRYSEMQKDIEHLYDDNNQSYISYIADSYKDSFKKNNCYWKNEACSEKKYDLHIKEIKKWLKLRNEWMLKNI